MQITSLTQKNRSCPSLLGKSSLIDYKTLFSSSIQAAQDIYFGSIKRYFPDKPDLDPDKYPNVSNDIQHFVQKAITEVESQKTNSRFFRWFAILRLFAKNFPTAGVWDTNFNPLFPGREKNGNNKYALYKNRVVSASYVGNNVFGQICAATGLPLWFAMLSAHLDSCGIIEIFTKCKIPAFKKLVQFDSSYSQRYIASGYYDYLYNNPWFHKSLDPKQPYPKK